MSISHFTIINIVVIELSFLLGKWLIKKRIFAIEFIISVFLAFVVWGFSFGGMVVTVFQHISQHGNTFTLMEVLLIFVNGGWAFFRGLRRIYNIQNEGS